jgi:hypothetical protein
MALRRSNGHLPDAGTAAAQFEARVSQRMAAMDLVAANARSEPVERDELAALIDRYGMSVLFAEVVRISGLMVEALTNQAGVPPELVLDAVRKKVRLDLTTSIIENKQRTGVVPPPSRRVFDEPPAPAQQPAAEAEPVTVHAEPAPHVPNPYDHVAPGGQPSREYTDGQLGGHGPTGRYGPDGRTESPRLTVLDGGAAGRRRRR